jgi:Zn-finger nucleic acid-binding protein
MECPVDGTALETHTISTVKVEECVECKGIWFEGDELRRALEASDPDLGWLDFDLWSDQDSFTADWSSRNCPQCGKTMASISYAATGVKIDYCTAGHGIWLDKGEFAAIIEALDKEIVSKDVSDYVSSSVEEAKEIFVGDKGFISEWKDFLTVTRLLQYRVLAENPKVAELLSALQTSTPFK